MTRTVRTVLVVLSAAGCGEATLPQRPDPYPFAINLANGFRIVFRWTAPSLPVRVWAEPTGDLRQQTAEAIRVWEGLALYREFFGVLVRDSAGADVLVRRGEPRAFNVEAAVQSASCTGWTTIGVELDTTITLPFRITVAPRAGANSTAIDRCFRLTLAHELGHALGLFVHSDDPEDLMHGRPNPQGPSERDQITFATLYHSPPTVRLPAGREP